MHSISDLTTYCRKTTGDVPSRLVGASTTVVGSKMYLFGGRLVTERKMVSEMYIFDLETFVWSKLPPSLDEDVPGARYFHSADVWSDHLVICGGMGHKADSANPEELCVLNDVRFFNFTTRRWLPATSPGATAPGLAPDYIPKPRYAHLSSISADRLFIIGGQDLSNIWLDDVHVYDLLGKTWLERRSYPRHVGTYRSIAVAADQRVRLPQEELKTSLASASLGPTGTRFRTDNAPPSSPPQCTPSESLSHLPYSAPPTDEFPSDIYLYSNYNFTDVKREFEVFSPLPDTDFTITDRSAEMTGTSFPPGLRFPSGAMLGTHFIIAGTYIAHTYQSFSIWSLDLLTMQWTRIDPGGAVSSGSWFRGCLWADANKFLIFGNRNGNLVEDYNRRLLSWDHVAVIDLESFGIYQPPPLLLNIPMQELGLAALEEGVLADFEIVCDDGRKIKCSRKMLEERWPWFKDQRQKFLLTALETAETLPTSPMHIALPELPGVVDPAVSRPDPRLTPRSFQLSEPYPITLALLQYFYSLALITPLQQAPAVLSQLLVLSSTYQIPHLQSLVKHAMHRMLSNSTSVGVYEVATLCSCRSLQIRALKTVMSYSQKRPSGRSRRDSRSGGGGGGGGGSGRRPDMNGSSGGPGGDDEPPSATARPRGTSDAQFRGAAEPQSSTMPPGSSNFSSQPIIQTSPPALPAAFQANLSPARRSSSFQPTFICHKLPHKRAPSVLSTNAHSELFAMAELMSPAIVDAHDSYAEEQEQTGDGMDDELDAFIEPYLHTGVERPSSLPYLRPFSNPPPSSSRNSMYDESDFEHSDSETPYSPRRPIYPAFHLPSPRPGLAKRDSDTPSLSSSTSYSSLGSFSRSQSHRNSPPASPASLVMPLDCQAGGSAHLAIIEERIAEDQKFSHRISEESDAHAHAVTFVVPEPYEEPKKDDTLRQRDMLLLRRRLPQLEPLKLTDSTTRTRSRSPSLPRSPTSSIGSYTVSPLPPKITTPSSGSRVSLIRFMGVGKGGKGSLRTDGDIRVHSVQSNVSIGTVTSRKQEIKQRKAEEKAQKKQEAKAKVDRLGLQLKEKTKQRALALEKEKKAHLGKSGARQTQWTPVNGPIFGGLL